MKVEVEMAMDLYTRSSSRGSLKQAWSGEDARAAAWLGGTLRDAGTPCFLMRNHLHVNYYLYICLIRINIGNFFFISYSAFMGCLYSHYTTLD